MSQALRKSSATIHDIPPELLSKIFGRCLAYGPEFSTRRTTQAPLLLGRICSKWRAVSISTPELWASFAVGDNSFNSMVDHRKDKEAMEVWISSQRGRGHFNVDPHHRNFLVPALEKIQFEIPSALLHIALHPIQAGRAERLEQLSLIAKRDRETDVDPGPIVLTNAPRLKNLFLILETGIPVNFAGRTHDIKSLIFSPFISNPKVSLSDFFKCLTNCPLLEILHLPVNEPSQITTHCVLPHIIQHSHLRSLKLSLFGVADPSDLFDRLCLLALKVLDLQILGPSSKTDWPHLRSMLINSRPPLNELILSGIPMSEETFLECLSYTPALTKLTAWGIRFSDTTLGFLTIKDATIKTSAALCPRLKFLDLGLNSHFSPSAMKELIISRSQDSVQVAETVTTRELLRTVYCSSFMMESVLSDPAIAKCVNEGLECLQLECE